MIREASFIRTNETYPYRNLALEECLFNECRSSECILYIWQNRNTVVIGKNQNCYKECKVEELENDDGFLVRRLSGGGAVFHDMGNLNFTFLVRKENFDIDRQLDVIICALKKMGIDAGKTGRNDLHAGGRKISGNAFYESGDRCYHHGTILLDVDTEKMLRYLNVDKAKLVGKGVDSVKSRVINLREICPDISTDSVSDNLLKAFGEIYGVEVTDFDMNRIGREKLRLSEERFSSPEWKYGRNISFAHEFASRFEWGDVQIRLNMNGDIIRDAEVFSDALDAHWADMLSEGLKGRRYTQQEICEAVDKAVGSSTLPENALEEIRELVYENMG